MFINETHLPQSLTPDQYTSPEQYDLELRRLFEPSWQFVGTTADLRKEGDYFTLEMYNRPLIVWNSGGKVHTFLNVCPHRFSRLRNGCGHAGERLVCQYHGWEFDETGNTRKIPDAQSFRPMEKGELGLSEIRTETCGQLIFVNLSGDAPELAEFLGPAHDVARELCSDERVNFHNLDVTAEANWKIKVENSLESYHHEMVHPSTFTRVPEPEVCTHELHPGWTKFGCLERAEGKLDGFLDRLAHRFAHVEPDYEYKHWLFYPNLMFAKARLFSWAEIVMPVSPTRLRIRTAFFCNLGNRPHRTGLLQKAMSAWGRKYFTQVAFEDVAILPEVQRGYNSPARPSKGVISIREERIFHFQEYIQRATASETSPAASEPMTVGA